MPEGGRRFSVRRRRRVSPVDLAFAGGNPASGSNPGGNLGFRGLSGRSCSHGVAVHDQVDGLRPLAGLTGAGGGSPGESGTVMVGGRGGKGGGKGGDGLGHVPPGPSFLRSTRTSASMPASAKAAATAATSSSLPAYSMRPEPERPHPKSSRASPVVRPQPSQPYAARWRDCAGWFTTQTPFRRASRTPMTTSSSPWLRARRRRPRPARGHGSPRWTSSPSGSWTLLTE